MNWQAAIIIGILLALGAWLGSKCANQMKGSALQLTFGIFAVVMGSYTIFTALSKIRQ